MYVVRLSVGARSAESESSAASSANAERGLLEEASDQVRLNCEQKKENDERPAAFLSAASASLIPFRLRETGPTLERRAVGAPAMGSKAASGSKSKSRNEK